jgi:asparagine synthase (glutamine-hydrolysing)
MCGISGIISFNEPVDVTLLKKLNYNLIHRGPDGEGSYVNEKVGLAMRRLSIIDLKSGWQPLYNEDKSIVLVMNGEIYNYIELQNSLKKNGHQFTTKSDSETVVHLYEDFGIECIKQLRGMFAFALYDIKKNLLYLVRDRLGEKPLYYFKGEERLIFSSELRALYKSGLVTTTLNYHALDEFFHYHYIPEPQTPFKEISKLEAGHYLQVDFTNDRIIDHCYWNLSDAPALTGDPAEMIREQLHEVGKIIIRSDVPVGVALSGGLDSSIVAALAMRNYGDKMNAFSVGYEGMPESDERGDARKFAEYLGMPFHEIELKTKNLIDFFPTLVGLTDDPIADISAFGYYSLSKEVKAFGVPVLLQGQGGDELFWGYPWVKKLVQQAKYKALLHKYHPAIALFFYLKMFMSGMNLREFRRWIKQAGGIIPSVEMFMLHKKFPLNQLPFYEVQIQSSVSEIRSLYGSALKEAVRDKNPYQFAEKEIPWNNIEVLYTELITKSYLLENGIAQGDRLSMANSVELRLPLVDYKLFETVIGLRKSYNDSDNGPKFWLKQATKDIIPDWVAKRKKRGFEPPVTAWIKGIMDRYGENLVNGRLVEKGVLSKESAIMLSKNPSKPFGMAFPQSFNAIVLEHWFRSLE